MKNYIENNIELITNSKATPFATPLRTVKGLVTTLKTLHKEALINPSHQYVDESMVTIQISPEEVWNISPRRFKKDYSVNDTRNAIRLLSLAGMLVPCTWALLNYNAKDEKMAAVHKNKDESGYIGLPSVYMIPDLAYYENLHCDRITRSFNIKTPLTYLSLSAAYDYNTANFVYGNLNNWGIPSPTVNQAEKLVHLVDVKGVVTLEESKKYLVPSKFPKGYVPPTSNSYFTSQLNALKMTGWLHSQGVFFDTASKVNPVLTKDISRNSKVLYTRSSIKR